MDIQHLLGQPARLAILAGSVAALACGRNGDTAVDQIDSTARPLPPAGSFGDATITGVVRFAGTPPTNSVIDMRAAPQCRAIYHSPPRQLSVIVNPNGTLANVFVYVKRGLPPSGRYGASADTLLLRERGCQYHPRVVGVLVGQALALRNDDVVPHQIEASGVKTQRFTIPQAVGRSNTHIFRAAEVMVPLQCARHPWMRAYVGILPHPFFATTGDDGRFTISRLPPGTYTLEAWHEGYGRRTATVTVRDSTTQRVNFTISEISD